MKEVVIVSAVRTPVGSFGGALKDVSAVDLGVTVVKEAMKRANIKGSDVDELYFGSVLQAGLGQGVGRQVSINSGIPYTVPGTTVNMLCGSGLRTISLGAQTILLGDNDVVVAGGTESMSRAPYVSNQTRYGARMGDVALVDTMLKDGLTDAFEGYHMGITAENIAEKYNLTREMQDEFAANSQNKAEKAMKENRFKEEIVPVSVKQRRGDDKIVDTDEFPRAGVTKEGLSKLRPAFKKGGTVTAGNSSGINDGAAAVVLMSKEKADELGIKPLATIVSYANGGVDPSVMGLGPIPASRNALEKLDLTIDDMDLIEANEAFAAQSLAVGVDLKWDPAKVNVNGGAISLGHPIGASGARILVTLLHEMLKRDSKYGLATLCIGGGMGTSIILKR